MNLARLGNKYLADNEPWKIAATDEMRVRTILNLSLQITASLSVLCEPFLPFTAKKLSGMINLSGLAWKDASRTDLLPAGHKLGIPELLFEKIEDDVIHKQVEKLLTAKKMNEQTTVPGALPQKAAVTFDEFSKMDIRTGTILSAEKVANADKLLKLSIHTGIDTRTVVSGIAEHYKPEEIVGKQVSILVNLAPRKIKGIESQGMILLAEDPVGKLRFVLPEEKMDDGSIVK
jgi:methionyl-tRNA synthetase